MITEVIDRNFTRAALWCLIAAAFSWVGLMHSAILGWGAQPSYAAGWLSAAAIVYSCRWWRKDAVLGSIQAASERHTLSGGSPAADNPRALTGVHSKTQARAGDPFRLLP
jgi:hypothetical protein